MMNIIFTHIHILAHIQNIHDIHFAYLNIVNLLVNMTRIPPALNAPKIVVFIHVHIHFIFLLNMVHIHYIFTSSIRDIHLVLSRAPDIHDRYLQC